MIIIEVDDFRGGIEKALKNYKRKFNNLKIGKECRQRQAFEKPSEKKRSVVLNAIYKEETIRLESDN
jgi:small subunit ribosomal protein S21